MFDKLVSFNDTSNRIFKISVDNIFPNPDQPRKVFEKRAIEELASSISVYGVLQPLTIKRISNDKFELIAGERRLKAAKMAGLKSVPCIISSAERQDSAIISLIENIQRQDLSFFEEAMAISKLIKQYSMTQEQVAKKLGKNQSTVANKLRLLNLPLEIRDKIAEHSLTERHARALLRIPENKDRMMILNEVINKKLGVSQTEKKVEKFLQNSLNGMDKVKHKRIGFFKDIRIFTNTINNALVAMKDSGVQVQSEKKENNEYIEYSIRITKNTA